MVDGDNRKEREASLEAAVRRGACKVGPNQGIDMYYFPKVAFGEKEEGEQTTKIERTSHMLLSGFEHPEI